MNWLVQHVDCFNTGSIEILNVEGGFGLRQFSLDGINFSDETRFDNLVSGVYTVFVEDNFGCGNQQTITIQDNTQALSEIIEIPSVAIGEVVTLDPDLDINEIDYFEWEHQGNVIDNENIALDITAEEDTDYILTVYKNNCIQRIIYRVTLEEIIEIPDLYTGNVFSPNGDGSNDYFYIQSTSDTPRTIVDFSIYDRWGNLIYNKNKS